MVAYEPVWAIGTGRTASPEQAQAMHAAIRGALAERFEGGEDIEILYGGSVKPDNAAELFAQDDLDGALVGGRQPGRGLVRRHRRRGARVDDRRAVLNADAATQHLSVPRLRRLVTLVVLLGVAGCAGSGPATAPLDASAASYRAGEPVFVLDAVASVRDDGPGVDVALGVPPVLAGVPAARRRASMPSPSGW